MGLTWRVDPKKDDESEMETSAVNMLSGADVITILAHRNRVCEIYYEAKMKSLNKEKCLKPKARKISEKEFENERKLDKMVFDSYFDIFYEINKPTDEERERISNEKKE